MDNIDAIRYCGNGRTDEVRRNSDNILCNCLAQDVQGEKPSSKKIGYLSRKLNGMEGIELKFNKELVFDLFRQLPQHLKMELFQEWLREKEAGEESLLIEGYEEPFDLEAAALSRSSLVNLQALWKEELSAEELCDLLD